MFRLLKLSPPHGWVAVLWELGIVTLGVLIALGAQQVVEAAQWREQVGAFRAAVRQEVAWNLGTADYRTKQNHCVKARLDQLERWMRGWQSGHPQTLTGKIGAPMSVSLYTSAWQSRDPSMMAHIPLAERLAFGELYDEFANNEGHRLDERQTWLALAKYDGATALDHGDLMELGELISRARYRDQRMSQNLPGYFETAKAMGLRPRSRDFPAYEPTFCRPILPPPSPGARAP